MNLSEYLKPALGVAFVVVVGGFYYWWETRSHPEPKETPSQALVIVTKSTNACFSDIQMFKNIINKSWDVDNNIWLIGDDSDVIVFDAAHTSAPIIDAVAGRNVVAVICTHGHNDHITVAPELAKALDAPVFLHPADEMLWRVVHPEAEFRSVQDGLVLTAGGIELHALHTPGHSPGSVCWSAPALNAVVSGDTLFQGGPGATGRSFSDFPTILESISKKLGTLADETVVYTGHGDTTTIGDV